MFVDFNRSRQRAAYAVMLLLHYAVYLDDPPAIQMP